jgi:tetratricopeptide (TPR) repeat protein
LLFPQVLAGQTLAMTGDVDEAFAGLDRVLLEARRQKLPIIVGQALGARGTMYLWCGRLTEAAFDFACLAEEIPAHCWHPLSAPVFAAYEAVLHLELDDPERAEEIIETTLRSIPDRTAWPHGLLARGAVRLDKGEAEAAVSDLEECGRRLRGKQVYNTTLLPWRRLAALAKLSCGDKAGAERLAAEQLALARNWGDPIAVGDALLISGMVADGPEAERLLIAAVSTLEKTPLQNLHAHALARLAAARGSGEESASLLRQAIKIVELNGARRLLRRIIGIAGKLELTSAIGPLSDVVDSAVDLAVKGLSNIEIADALSMSERTVEELLTASAHRKPGAQRRNASSVGNEG